MNSNKLFRLGCRRIGLALTRDGDERVKHNGPAAELAGTAALDLMDARLRGNACGIAVQQKTLFIPGHWVFGSTVREVALPASHRRR